MTTEEKASTLHDQGYNCAQSVLLTLSNHSGMDEKTAAAIATGFGGGAGCRELCGAISGAIMTAGLKYGAENRPQINTIDRELVSAFREKFGAVRCEDLKAAKIPCDALIRFAAAKADELLSQ